MCKCMHHLKLVKNSNIVLAHKRGNKLKNQVKSCRPVVLVFSLRKLIERLALN